MNISCNEKKNFYDINNIFFTRLKKNIKKKIKKELIIFIIIINNIIMDCFYYYIDKINKTIKNT